MQPFDEDFHHSEGDFWAKEELLSLGGIYLQKIKEKCQLCGQWQQKSQKNKLSVLLQRVCVHNYHSHTPSLPNSVVYIYHQILIQEIREISQFSLHSLWFNRILRILFLQISVDLVFMYIDNELACATCQFWFVFYLIRLNHKYFKWYKSLKQVPSLVCLQSHSETAES